MFRTSPTVPPIHELPFAANEVRRRGAVQGKSPPPATIILPLCETFTEHVHPLRVAALRVLLENPLAFPRPLVSLRLSVSSHRAGDGFEL